MAGGSAGNFVTSQRFMSAWAAYFGDAALALELAEQATSILPQQMRVFWYPAFESMRQQPGFSRMVEDLRLPEFWDEHGWPPFCDRTNGQIRCR
jgi:hypothetical protein